jgi:uncharacterized membrane protein
MVGLGILALIYRDFALVWQPVPAWLPGRAAIAVASGVLMLLCGLGLLLRPTSKWSAQILFPYLIAWTLLKFPDLVTAPLVEGSWLGFGELAVLLAGGWTLFARLAPLAPPSPLAFATGDRGVRLARILFALWVIPVGLSHFVYVDGTAGFIPAWIPFHLFFAYLTGAGHIASGLGVLFSIFPRTAAWAETAMLTVFTLVIWAPAIAAAPATRLPWTAFFISWAITAAVAVVAQNIPPKSPAASKL